MAETQGEWVLYMRVKLEILERNGQAAAIRKEKDTLLLGSAVKGVQEENTCAT